jgi:hypothetical protein
MNEGGEIYTKAIDASVQDGIDNVLIIQPNYAYQKEFAFGDDWTEIFVGFFLSYTDSPTIDNSPFASGDSRHSGGTVDDTWTYMGIIRNNDVKYLPSFGSATGDAEKSFIGFRIEYINDPHPSFSSGGFNSLNVNGGNQDVISLGGSNEYTFDSLVGGEGIYLPLMYSDATTSFAGYVGMKFEVLNKGTPTQQIRLTQYSPNTGGANNILSTNVSYTDISLTNLKSLINAENFITDGVITLDFNNGVSATNIPDSFFFYNAFLDARPRIHAIAVKKLS